MRFLWKLSEKVSEKVSDYLAPMLITNSVEEFKDACRTVLAHIQDPDADSTTSFIGALNNMQDYLTDEINEDKVDQPCVAFLVEQQIMDKIVQSIDTNFPHHHVEPILKFFLSFVKTDLNRLFAQISVHRPFTKFLTLLPVLCLRNSAPTREFANDLWNAVKSSPLTLEMMSSEKDLPLIDFFSLTALLPGDDGDLSRSTIFSISVQKGLPRFRNYIKDQFFPELAEFILNTASDAQTFQFSGSLSKIIEWIDFLLSRIDDFPVDLIQKGINELNDSQQVLAVAFLLSCFSADVILQPIGKLAISQQFLTKVMACLKSSEEIDQKSGLTFLRIIFECELPMTYLMPPISPNQTDVLSCIPAPWLVALEGSTGMDAYECDALARFQFFGRERIDGTNPEVFLAVLDLFKRFKTIPVECCLSVTKVIISFISLAPDLISDDLTKAFSEAVTSLSDVQVIEIATNEMTDSPGFRAVLLAEFGKEVHATFVASEKLKGLGILFPK